MTKKLLIPIPGVVAISPDSDDIDDIDERKETGLSVAQATEMFAELKLLRAEETRITKPLQDAIDAILEPIHMQILAIEGQLKLHTVLRQESIETTHGTAVYTTGYYRVSYLREDIDMFADKHPDIADDLRNLRKETWVKEKVSIRMK